MYDKHAAAIADPAGNMPSPSATNVLRSRPSVFVCPSDNLPVTKLWGGRDYTANNCPGFSGGIWAGVLKNGWHGFAGCASRRSVVRLLPRVGSVFEFPWGLRDLGRWPDP